MSVVPRNVFVFDLPGSSSKRDQTETSKGSFLSSLSSASSLLESKLASPDFKSSDSLQEPQNYLPEGCAVSYTKRQPSDPESGSPTSIT